MNFGYYKLLAVSPRLYLGNVPKNKEEHLKILKEVSSKKPAVVLFPELSLVGYTAEDLLQQQSIVDASLTALIDLAQETKNLDSLIVVGIPLQRRGKLYNSAACIFKGKIVNIYRKTFVPNYKEFYENRYFSEGPHEKDSITIGNQEVSLNNELILKIGKLHLGVEICEDGWTAKPPSVDLALSGAHLILNLSASNELVGKESFRRDLFKMASARLNCGYLYNSSGPWESSKDLVFGGYQGYFEDGSLIKEDKTYSFSSKILETEIDVERIDFERRKNTSFGKTPHKNYPIMDIGAVDQTLTITRTILENPFVPQGTQALESRVQEILEIQATGLARRLLTIGPKTQIVLGLSGGLDSTLALLVAVKACEKLGLPTTTIHTLSMPGFGTSQRTKGQAFDLAQAFGTTYKEIDITKATTQHLVDIDHKLVDFVYENAQARERTQVLFDYANKVGGFVQNTSSLSECFCGWSTYNADQTGNYGTNLSVPKTLVKFLIKHYPANEEQKEILKRVYETPISPELLPLDNKGNIQQSTEEVLGPYEIIDFYIFYYLRYGFKNSKILFLAEKAFNGKHTKDYLSEVFRKTYKRFRINQFKRTTAPPGMKLGVSLSPRGDLRLPDEAGGDENE